MKARPAVGLVRVVRMPMVVDFPAPFGPKSPKTSPGRISKEIPSRATSSNFFLVLSLRAERWKPNEKPAPRAAMGGGVL